MFIALTMTQPVATSAVYTLVPLMTAVTAYFIVGQRSGLAVLISLLLAGMGAIWVIFRGDLDALLRFDIGQGELIYFVGCVAYAIYTPLLRRFNRGESALVLSFWTMLATAIWLVLYGAPEILATDWMHLPALVWWVVLYLAIGPTAVCFFLIQYASARLAAAKVIAYGSLVPAFVIVFEGAAGHGWTSLSVVAGAAVSSPRRSVTQRRNAPWQADIGQGCGVERNQDFSMAASQERSISGPTPTSSSSPSPDEE